MPTQLDIFIELSVSAHSGTLKQYGQPSNDVIYAGDMQCRELFDQLQSDILGELLDYMDQLNQKLSIGTLSDAKEPGILVDVALGVAEQLVLFCDFDEVLMKLTSKLMALAHKYMNTHGLSRSQPTSIVGRMISTRQTWFDDLAPSIRPQAELNLRDLDQRQLEDRMSALEQWKHKSVFAELFSRLRRIHAYK